MEHWRTFSFSFGSVRISYYEHILFFKNNNINLLSTAVETFLKNIVNFFFSKVAEYE